LLELGAFLFSDPAELSTQRIGFRQRLILAGRQLAEQDLERLDDVAAPPEQIVFRDAGATQKRPAVIGPATGEQPGEGVSFSPGWWIQEGLAASHAQVVDPRGD